MTHQDRAKNPGEICIWKGKSESSPIKLYCDRCDGLGTFYDDFENPTTCEAYSSPRKEKEKVKSNSSLERDETWYP